MRHLLLLTALLAATTVRGALPVIPAPKSVVEGAVRPSVRFSALHFSGSAEQAPYAAVLDEIEALADTAAARPLVVELVVAERAAKEHLRRYVPEAGHEVLHRDLYGLRLTGDTARLVAATEAGGHCALQTLKQLLRAGYARETVVTDWCDLRQRIFMDDISRGAVPTPEQLRRQIRYLAELKYNAAMYYIEHVVRTESHPDFAPADGSLTLDEIRDLGRYAASYGIELIGNFQSFGHFENILAHERYRPLGDTETMISTTDPRARKFLSEVLGELCDAFPSAQFNVNCDETWDIGNGRSRERVRQVGRERFYADHIRFLRDELRRRGKRTMMWSDMVLKYPRLLDLLPRDIVLLTWNYDARDDFSAWLDPLRGREFLVCPGVHSSGRMVPDMRAAEGNRRFIAQGYAAGARGALLTSWDEGALHCYHHLCYGIAQAAETMWDTRRTQVDDDFRARYETLRFGAPNGFTKLCDAMMRLGDLPMLSGMNDRIYYQRFTPQPGRPLTVDLAQLRTADSIARACSGAFDECPATSARAEIDAWHYAADSYRLIAGSRLRMARIAELYAGGTREGLAEAVAHCDTLQQLTASLRADFSRLWLYENRHHSYDRGIRTYREKAAEIERVRDILADALRRLDSRQPLPTPAEAGLEVRDRQNGYMCFWLTTGPFTGCEPDADPEGVRSSVPTPGLKFVADGREYKWTKTESFDGLTMDGNRFYTSGGDATMYAWALLTSPDEREVDLLVGYAGRLTLCCNGEPVYAGPVENAYAPDSHRIRLRLRAGENHLLVKLRQEVPEWMFSCIVEGAVVSSRKHKYTID
ncbi:MAG: beta-N-acetylhexosaminidase [Alistipes sp.]|nr:beta-N-acetylhexosaminidase [Alistipes sp.]